ncbi:MAG: tetratricopeptide repeat protein [Candidatus Hodarchaeota archaeon]
MPELEKGESNISDVEPTLSSASPFYLIFVLVYTVLFAIIGAVGQYLVSERETSIFNIIFFLNYTWFPLIGAVFIIVSSILFYFLADIVGRKLMLIIAFVGTSAFLYLISLSNHQFNYLILTLFLLVNPVIIFLAEEAPKAKRAQYIYLIFVSGALGTLGAYTLTNFFLAGYAPAWSDYWTFIWVLMIVIGFFSIPIAFSGLALKETAAFQAYKTTVAKWNKERVVQTFFQPFSSEYRQKTVVFIVIGFIFGLSSWIFTNWFRFFHQIVNPAPQHMSTLSGWQWWVENTMPLIFIGFLIYILFYGITAIFVDKFGRKPVFYSYVLIMVICIISNTLLLAVDLASLGNYIPIYILNFIGTAAWAGGFTLVLVMNAECFPTKIRSTAIGWQYSAYTCAAIVATFIVGSLNNPFSALWITKETYLTFVVLFVVPLSPVLPLLVMKFLPETKGISLVEIYIQMGELDKALEYLQRAQAEYREYGNLFRVAWSLDYLGQVYRHKGELDQALLHFEQSREIFEKARKSLHESESLFYLVNVAIDMKDLDRARNYLQRLHQLSNQSSNKILRQRYQVAMALLLKTSIRAIKRGKAEELLKQVVQDELLDYEIYSSSLLHLCDLLLIDLHITNEREILDEIKILVNKLMVVTQQQRSPWLLVETYLLQSKLALLELDIQEAQKFLDQAQSTAEEKNLQILANHITQERDLLREQKSNWEQLAERNSSISERLELSQLEVLLMRMTRRRMEFTEQDVINYAQEAKRFIRSLKDDMGQ